MLILVSVSIPGTSVITMTKTFVQSDALWLNPTKFYFSCHVFLQLLSEFFQTDIAFLVSVCCSCMFGSDLLEHAIRREHKIYQS